MEPFVITVTDKSIIHELESRSQSSKHPDHDSQALMFPTNIRYIFEDDEPEQDEDPQVENVIVAEVEKDMRVKHVELISDEYQLLSYQSTGENELELEAVSKFQNVHSQNLPLKKLIELYKRQNEQLDSLFNTL